MRLIRAGCLLFLLCGAAAHAETIYFKNGAGMKGAVRVRGDMVTITSPTGLVTRVRRSAVDRIEGSARARPTSRRAPRWQPPRARRRTSPRRPAWVRRIEKKLDQRISVSFEATPVRDAINFLRSATGINFVFAPDLETDDLLVTLDLKDVKVRSVLRWIAMQTKLEFILKDEVVLLGTEEQLPRTESVAVLDVRDQMLAVMDRPRRPNILGEAGRGGNGGFGEMGFAGGQGYSTAPGMKQDAPLPARGRGLVGLLMHITGSDQWAGGYIVGMPPEDFYY